MREPDLGHCAIARPDPASYIHVPGACGRLTGAQGASGRRRLLSGEGSVITGHFTGHGQVIRRRGDNRPDCFVVISQKAEADETFAHAGLGRGA